MTSLDERRPTLQDLWRVAAAILGTVAVVQKLRKPEDQRTWHGAVAGLVPLRLPPTDPIPVARDLGVEVVGIFFFDDNVWALRKGDPIEERLAAVAAHTGMLIMACDNCALERNLAKGEPRWCDPSTGQGRTEPGECEPVDLIDGATVGCFPDLYTALSGNMPDQVISL